MDRTGNVSRISGEIPISGDADNGLITAVHEGMKVVDAGGEELGTVERVQIGDPDSVTVREQERVQGGIMQNLADAFGAEGEPRVPEPLRSRLLRSGYVKIDGKGWIDTDRYVSAEHIVAIDEDTVSLSLLKDQILSDKDVSDA